MIYLGSFVLMGEAVEVVNGNTLYSLTGREDNLEQFVGKSWIESDAWQNVNKRKYLRRLASKRLRVLLKREEDNA